MVATGMRRSRSGNDDGSAPVASKPAVDVPPGTLLKENTDTGIQHVAFHRHVQSLMDHYHIAWGTQWEISRGVTNGWWQWSDVTAERLSQLVGDNQSSAPRVPQVMLNSNVRVLQSQMDMWYVC